MKTRLFSLHTPLIWECGFFIFIQIIGMWFFIFMMPAGVII